LGTALVAVVAISHHVWSPITGMPGERARLPTRHVGWMLLHAYKKQRQKAPMTEIETADQRTEEVLAQGRR
jgi:hypothetical protein